MTENVRLVEFYHSMRTLEPGDVLSCNRDGKKLYSVMLRCTETSGENWYELSRFCPFMGFEPYPHKVALNSSGWLEDEHGGIILMFEEWDSTEKGIAKEILPTLPKRETLDIKKGKIFAVLRGGSTTFRDDAGEILRIISEDTMSESEVVELFAHALALTASHVWRR